MKNSIKINPVLACLIIGLAISSCSTNNEIVENTKVSAINPPFKGVDIEGDNFSFDASKDTEIRTKEGTTISIPANSLVDETGKKIKGKVDLSFKSINKASEIIASGIPMTYDSAGVKNDFISAGMFDIAASQKGKEIFIEKGKNIDVDFASYKEGNDFSFYKINKESGKWSYKGISTPKVNHVKLEKLRKFDEENLIQLNVDYSTHDELKPFHGLKWLCLNDKNNPLKNRWILKENWREISLSVVNAKKGIYSMELSNESKTVKFQVSPYLMENESVADMTSKINQLNETVKEKKMEEERIQFEADITRNYKISSFGTYNWDKIEREVASGVLAFTNAEFQINSKSLDKEMSVFHFSGKDKLLSRISKKWDKLVFNPNEVNKFLIVLPENYVAISDEKEFKSAKDSKTFLFHLKKRSKKISSIADLDAILAEK
ncbi:MAG: hypothetical protein V4622_11180 [Bacteroidota bacterium]